MILGFLSLGFVLLVLLVHGLTWLLIGLWRAGEFITFLVMEHQQTRRALVVVERERAVDDVRAALRELTDALGAEAHEVRRQLIRESLLASGELTPLERRTR